MKKKTGKRPFAKSKAAKHLARRTGAGRRAKPAQTVQLNGVFAGSGRGYGFVTADADAQLSADIFIPARAVHGALSGDRVTVAVRKSALAHKTDAGLRIEGEITGILSRGVTRFCGTLCISDLLYSRAKQHYYVLPDDPKLHFEAAVTDVGDIPVGSKVEVELCDYGDGSRPPRGRILRDLGDTRSLGANYESILTANGIRTEFPEEAVRCAEAAAAETVVPDGRTDLREKIIFTIDGADAKDLDDAISLDVTDDGYILGVHIADVSHYVQPGTPTDDEAFARGTSVYFTDKVVPMLPESLCNGACSLNAGADRYALSALITLDTGGQITDCKIENTVIRSAVRGVYSEVNDLFAHKSRSKYYKKYKTVYKTLTAMYPLYRLLKSRADARGVLELESAEACFVLDGEGMPVEVIRRERGDAERMIEQFMLTANEAVARTMCARSLPCVFRVHEAPSEEKLLPYRNFLHNLGLSTISLHGDRLSTAAFAPVLREAAEKGLSDVVSRVTLRAQMKAKYSAFRADHFGLGLSHYCHFTSPIRRYPDLSVHRILKYALENGDAAAKRKYASFAAESAAASSEAELRAMAAERDISDLYKVLFMQKEIGNIFPATVSSVTSFGLFCELENTCEGLIPIETLGDGFVFHEETMTLSRGRRSYKLGQTVRVRITDCDILRRRVYMELCDQE